MRINNLKVDKKLIPQEFLNEFLNNIFKYKIEVISNIEQYVNINIAYFEKKYGKKKVGLLKWKKEMLKNKKYISALMKTATIGIKTYWKDVDIELYLTPKVRKNLKEIIKILLSSNMSFIGYIKWIREVGYGLNDIYNKKIFIEFLEEKNIKKIKVKTKRMN